MSAPRVGVARYRDGHVQVSYHRLRHTVADERGRGADFAAIVNEPPAPMLLDTYPGSVGLPVNPQRDPAFDDTGPAARPETTDGPQAQEAA